MITDAIAEMKEAGVNLIICTGVMSVDPDDKTPGAIKEMFIRDRYHRNCADSGTL